MPIPQRVQYSAAIEPLVQFIEDTPPAEIIDRTLEKLRDGASTRDMLLASALAVVRSSDLPPGHHGGPLHPLSGLHAVRHIAARLPGGDARRPWVPSSCRRRTRCRSRTAWKRRSRRSAPPPAAASIMPAIITTSTCSSGS